MAIKHFCDVCGVEEPEEAEDWMTVDLSWWPGNRFGGGREESETCLGVLACPTCYAEKIRDATDDLAAVLGMYDPNPIPADDGEEEAPAMSDGGRGERDVLS